MGIRCNRNLGSRTAGKRVGKTVVYITMMGFICPNHEHDITQCRIVRQHPVMPSYGRRRHILDMASVNLGQILAVADDRLFLEVADNAVCRRRADQVSPRKPI